jgi:hypothetical protein
LIGCYLKEFLLCIRELDVHVWYKEMHEASNKDSSSTNAWEEVCEGTSSTPLAKDKLGEQWWLKSNYISSLNLLEAMQILGPLINYWDGGGRGEQFIQEIKPHIPRGIHNGGQFFVWLLEKIFMFVAMQLIEKGCMPNDYNLLTNAVESDSDDEDETLDNESSTNSDPPIDAMVPMTININSESTNEEEDAALSNNHVEEQWSSPMEDEQMSKAQTVYIYKKRELLQEAVDNKDPIAGIIIKDINQSAELYALFKHPGKKFRWMRICFDDGGRIQWCGLWYTPFAFNKQCLGHQRP